VGLQAEVHADASDGVVVEARVTVNELDSELFGGESTP
jgi:hypothetical protein